MAGSDFEWTSPKLFWPETLVYLLPGAELNQMLTLIVAMKSETPCKSALLLFAGMNDHLHVAGLLETLGSEEPTPERIWEAIQSLLSALNEVQELVRYGLESKTKSGIRVIITCFTVRLRHVNSDCGKNGWRMLMAAPNRELELVNLRLLKSEVAAAWADVSHALRGFYELADK